MKNGLPHILFFLFYFLFLAVVTHAQQAKIYLHPKKAGGEKQSNVIDSIRFIPLEVKEGVQLSSFNYVTVTARYFLIVDYPEKTILLYSRKGDFVKQINYRKLGEGFDPEYYEQSNQLVFFGENKNYALTSKDRIKINQEWDHPRNKKYYKKYVIDLNDTALTIKKETPDENDILSTHPYGGGYHWQGKITTSNVYKDSLDYEVKIYKDNKLIKGYFPYNHINEPRFLYTEENAVFTPANTPASFFVTRPFCDTIYKIEKDNLAPVYQLVLPLENSLPPTFYTQPFKNKTERENFRRNNGWMFHQVFNFFENARLIYFRVRYLSNTETYLYHKKSQASYKIKSIRPDSTQYNIALLADAGLQRTGDKFYKSQKVGDLQQFFEQHKSIPVPAELKEFFRKKPPVASSVIVEFKLKN